MHVRINVMLCSYVHSIYFSHKLHQECILQSTVMVIRCPPMVIKVSSHGNKVSSHGNKVSSHGNKVSSHGFRPFLLRDIVAEVCLLYKYLSHYLQLLKKLMHVELQLHMK